MRIRKFDRTLGTIALVTAIGIALGLSGIVGPRGAEAGQPQAAAPDDAPVAMNEHAGHDMSAHHHHDAQAEAAATRSLQEISVPAVPLLRMDGQKTDLAAELAGQGPVLLNFIFTSCPSICPAMSAVFSQVQSRLSEQGESVRMVSISIDPEVDTPERLRDYAARFKAGSQWQFYTGTLDDIHHIQEQFSAYRGEKMSHAPLIFVRGAGPKDWVRLDGYASAEDLVKEYYRAKIP